VVELVLHDAGGGSFKVVPDLLPVRVAALDPHRHGPRDGHRHSLDGEAAFVVRFGFVAAADDLRIDQHGHLVLPLGEDEHAAEHADLSGGEADAVRVLHQLAHAGHEPLQVVVEVLDGGCLHPEDGVWVLADLGERELPPGLALGLSLGIELFVPDFSLYLGHAGTLAA
jgi:hypothetical protein